MVKQQKRNGREAKKPKSAKPVVSEVVSSLSAKGILSSINDPKRKK